VPLLAAPDPDEVVVAVEVVLAVVLRLLPAADRLGDFPGRRPVPGRLRRSGVPAMNVDRIRHVAFHGFCELMS
jgi:hypothetical protein